jgi:flagellar hook-associated protein 1 FlgK
MSLLGLFNIGKSAIFASQTALSVTGHNIANVNTPGYSRKEVILDIAIPVSIGRNFLGRGVSVSDIRRNYDRFIQSQLLIQSQNYGRSLAMERVLSQIEQVFNETDDLGIETGLRDFFGAWNDVVTNPESIPQRTVLLEKARSLVNTIKGMESRITDTIRHINEETDDTVKRINTIASDVARLNDSIVRIEAGQGREKATDLRDERDRLLGELSNLVDISTIEDKNGAVTVIVGMRNLVSGGVTNPLSTRRNENGDLDLYIDNVNVTTGIKSGTLGGLLSVRDYIESNPLHDLRKLAASLNKEVNILHRQGFGLDASTGNDFFIPLSLSTGDFSSGTDITATIVDPSTLTLDEYVITFDATNYYVRNKETSALVASGAYSSGSPIEFDGIRVVVTGAITTQDRFTVSPLTGAISNLGVAIIDPKGIAAASSETGLPGDNTNALRVFQLSEDVLSDLGGTTFSGYLRETVSRIGTMSGAASDSLRFEDNLLQEMKNRREAVSGVSLDEEAMNLVRFQRAFEAGARIIKVTDELLQTVLEL